MNDQRKTKKQLVEELVHLRQRVAALTSGEAAEHRPSEEQSASHDQGHVGERDDAERQVRESRSHLDALLACAPAVVWSIDVRGVITLSGGAGLRALGLQVGELQGKSIFEEFRDAPKVVDAARRALTGQSVVTSFTFGGVDWEVHYAPLRGRGDHVEGAIGIALDATRRAKAEKALAQSEKRLRRSEGKLAEAQAVACIGSWEWDALTDHTWWSAEGYRLFGIDPKAPAPNYEDYLNLTHPDDRNEVAACIAGCSPI